MSWEKPSVHFATRLSAEASESTGNRWIELTIACKGWHPKLDPDSEAALTIFLHASAPPLLGPMLAEAINRAVRDAYAATASTEELSALAASMRNSAAGFSAEPHLLPDDDEIPF